MDEWPVEYFLLPMAYYLFIAIIALHKNFLVAYFATLHPALSVSPYVGWSLAPADGLVVDAYQSFL